jgi:hypothetical protein
MFIWTTKHVFRAKSSQEVQYIIKELSLLFSQLNFASKKNKYIFLRKRKANSSINNTLTGQIAQFIHVGSLKTDISHNQWGKE